MNLINSIHDEKVDTVVESSIARNTLDPFKAIDRDDVLVSDRPEIRELNEYALDLDHKIPVELDAGYIESEFQSNRLAYVRNGLLLAKLKYLKLYKEFGDGTFSSFCRERLQITRWQINDTIKAARVTMDLIYAGFEILPKRDANASPVVRSLWLLASSEEAVCPEWGCDDDLRECAAFLRRSL